jgi:hypothetical protein
LSIAVISGCAAPQADQVDAPTPAPTVRPTQNPKLALAAAIPALVAAHRAGRPAILRKADAQAAIRTFVDAAKMLPYTGYRVDCPGNADLTGARRTTCTLHAGGKTVPYDLWVDDGAGQLRIGGHGFAIETARIRNVIAAEIQRRMPRTDISPYDVNCGDDDVIVIQPGSRVLCVFSADAVIVPFAVRFGDLQGHLRVEMLGRHQAAQRLR